MVAGT